VPTGQIEIAVCAAGTGAGGLAGMGVPHSGQTRDWSISSE